MVSAWLVEGFGATRELMALRQRLFQNAEQSVKLAAANSALKLTQPFQLDARASKLECWTLLAQTHEGGTLFYQAVFRHPSGVLLATFEAPKTAIAASCFEQFMQDVDVIAEKRGID